MTFEEAIQLKQKLKSRFLYEGGVKLEAFVTPADANELSVYLSEIREFFDDLSDKYALQYSRSSSYTVRYLGLNDLENIIHKSAMDFN